MPSSSLKVRLFTIKTAQLLMTILFLFLIYVLSRQAAALVLASSASAQTAPPTVVIDSGHGGNDPGKIGVDGSLESHHCPEIKILPGDVRRPGNHDPRF